MNEEQSLTDIAQAIRVFRRSPEEDPAEAFELWFRFAFHEWLETGSTEAFLPFTEPFDNPDTPERNVEQFVLRDLARVGNIAGVHAREVLSRVLKEELAGIGRTSSPLVTELENGNAVGGLMVPTFRLLYALSRGAALDWFATMTRQWQPLGHMRNSNRVPLPVLLFSTLREGSPGDGLAAAAASAFFDWCVRHPTEPGVPARAVDALCLRVQTIPRAEREVARQEAKEVLLSYAPETDARTGMPAGGLAAATCSYFAGRNREGWQDDIRSRIVNALGDAGPVRPIYAINPPEAAAPILVGTPWFRTLVEALKHEPALEPEPHTSVVISIPSRGEKSAKAASSYGGFIPVSGEGPVFRLGAELHQLGVELITAQTTSMLHMIANYSLGPDLQEEQIDDEPLFQDPLRSTHQSLKVWQ